MFYRNALKGLRGSDRVYSVKSFGGGMNTVSEDFLLEQGVAKISYNLSGKTGALRECGGFSAFTLPFDGKETEVTIGNKAITKVWYYRRFDLPTRKNDDRILLLSEDKRLYNIYVNGLDLGVSLVDERQFEEMPEALNYRLNGEDVMIFCSGKDKMRVYNGVDTPTVIDDAPALSSICVHGERLFATSPDTLNTLWFSDDLDPTNWNISLDEAGFVEMADENGALLKVLSFFNYVYVFRSYGITRFYATGEQSRFSLMHLFVSSDRIIGDTVCVCGDRILFLTQRGLFDFDGSGTVKILDRLSGLFEGEDNSQARAAYFGGKYFLACRLNFNDGRRVMCEKGDYVNNALVEVDLASGSVAVVRGVDVASLAAVNAPDKNFLLACFRNEKRVAIFDDGGSVFGEAMPKRWVCPKTDLDGADRRKLLRYALIETEHDLTLCVEADGQEHTRFVRGSDRQQKVPFNVTGSVFRLSVDADTDKMRVSRPQLIFREY